MGLFVTRAYWNDIIMRINALQANPPSQYFTPPAPLSYIPSNTRISSTEMRRIQLALNYMCPWAYTDPNPYGTTLRELFIDEIEAGIDRGWCLDVTTRQLRLEIRWQFSPVFDVTNLDVWIPSSDWVESTGEYKIGTDYGGSYRFQRRVYNSVAGVFDNLPNIGIYKDLTIKRELDGNEDSFYHSFYMAKTEVRVFQWDPLTLSYYYEISKNCAPTHVGGPDTYNMYPLQYDAGDGLNDGGTWYTGKFNWDFDELDEFQQTAYDCPEWCYWTTYGGCSWWESYPDSQWVDLP